MKMKRRTLKGGGAQNKKRKPPPLTGRLPSGGSVASRTRGKKKVQAATWDQPVPILIHIVGFLDQATLMKVSAVCQQLHQICHGHVPGTTNIGIPVLELSVSENHDDIGRTDRMIHQLEQHCTKLQHYRKMTITDGHKFRTGNYWDETYKTYKKLEKFQLNGVVSLHILSSVATERISDSSLPTMFARILPNLREVNLSTSKYCWSTLKDFSNTCSSLEKVTWNNFGQSSIMDMSSATNLKEIYMDGAQFYDLSYARAFENDDTPDFLFYRSKVLERISIRNARNITQKMLIKFIRKAPPSLRWFRSDLTPANMAMLRLERPGIELLN